MTDIEISPERRQDIESKLKDPEFCKQLRKIPQQPPTPEIQTIIDDIKRSETLTTDDLNFVINCR